MRKLRRTLCAVALALAVVIVGATTAMAVPVAPNNTPPAAFPPAQTCACHSQFIDEWKQSMHGQALSDPIFKAKLAEGNTATNGQIGPFCITCHGPVATMTGQVGKTDPATAAAQGIGCTFCHQVTGTSNPTGNVSLILQPNGVYRAQIATPTAPHPTAYSPFHATSTICGSCHNVAHPGNGLPVEATYTEWQNSPQGKAGIQCQDCHMSSAPGEIGPSMGWAAGGGQLRPIYQMTFTGGQAGLGNSVLATQMLQSAATIHMIAPSMLDQSKTTSVTVSITNTGAGHYLPTGLTEIREMWLSVTMTGSDGKQIELGRHAYGTVLKNAAGKYPAQLWEATGVQSDDRIPPKGTSVQSYKITFPEGAQYGTLKAQLLYRSVPETLATKAKAPNPTNVMAETSRVVYANLAGEKQFNKVYLSEAASSPLMPLVFAIAGLIVSFGLVIFFVWWGRRPAKPTAPKPSKAGTDLEAQAPVDDSATTTRPSAGGPSPTPSEAHTPSSWAERSAGVSEPSVAPAPDAPKDKPAE